MKKAEITNTKRRKCFREAIIFEPGSNNALKNNPTCN
jgi:hypothetical protein